MTPGVNALPVRPWLQGVSYVEDDRTKHMLDGAPVIGVTSALKMGGKSADFSQVDPAVLDHKRQLGQHVHAAAHFFDEGDLSEASVHPEAVGYLAAWRRLCLVRRIRPVLLETVVVSRRFRYIGRLDRVAMVDARRWAVIDIKIGDPDDSAADLQTRAYEVALREELRHYARSHPALMTPVLDDLASSPWLRFAARLHLDGTYTLRSYPQSGRSNTHDDADFRDALRDAQQRLGFSQEPIPWPVAV